MWFSSRNGISKTLDSYPSRAPLAKCFDPGRPVQLALITSIFPFSHNVFYPSQMKFQFLRLILSSTSALNLDKFKNLSCGKVNYLPHIPKE